MITGILWSPLLPELESQAKRRGGIRTIISPFARAEPVVRLLSGNPPETRAAVMCRWSASDLASGIADLELFPALQDLGIPLFIHPEIHLKLYVFADRYALQGSGNATGSGLGLHGSQVEIASISKLSESDDQQIGQLFQNATRVTESIHEDLREYQREHHTPAAALPPLPQSAVRRRPADAAANGMKLDWLPMSRNPQDLEQLIVHPRSTDPIHGVTLRNDLEVLGEDLAFVPDPAAQAATRFLSLPIIRALMQRLEDRGHAQFGVLRDWLVDLAEDSGDIPDDQINEAVYRVRSWLAASSPHVEASRPNHTAMTFWRGGSHMDDQGSRS